MTDAERPSLGRSTGAAPTVVLLLLLTAGAWLVVLFGPDTMMAPPAVFLAAWTVMMAAMMLPSALPLMLLYRRGTSGVRIAWLATGYLAVWAVAGVPALLAWRLPTSIAGPLALAAAGIYQFTPLKATCLRRCRTPADFLIQHWGKGPLRLGVLYGFWCLGCCWALMTVLVLTGAMGLAWVVGLAGVVALEKLAPRGMLWARLTGAAFLIAAFAMGVT